MYLKSLILICATLTIPGYAADNVSAPVNHNTGHQAEFSFSTNRIDHSHEHIKQMYQSLKLDESSVFITNCLPPILLYGTVLAGVALITLPLLIVKTHFF